MCTENSPKKQNKIKNFIFSSQMNQILLRDSLEVKLIKKKNQKTKIYERHGF